MRNLIRSLLILSLVFLCGCTFIWNKKLKVGANGAKTKVYGTLEKGDVLYDSKICIGTKCKVCK